MGRQADEGWPQYVVMGTSCYMGPQGFQQRQGKLVGLLGKLIEYGLQVSGFFKHLTNGGVISSHQNYVATYSGNKGKEAIWIHHFVILQLFHVKFKKIGNINFVHDNHSLFVCHFNHNEDQEYMNIFEDMPSFEFLWLGERI